VLGHACVLTFDCLSHQVQSYVEISRASEAGGTVLNSTVLAQEASFVSCVAPFHAATVWSAPVFGVDDPYTGRVQFVAIGSPERDRGVVHILALAAGSPSSSRHLHVLWDSVIGYGLEASPDLDLPAGYPRFGSAVAFWLPAFDAADESIDEESVESIVCWLVVGCSECDLYGQVAIIPIVAVGAQNRTVQLRVADSAAVRWIGHGIGGLGTVLEVGGKFGYALDVVGDLSKRWVWARCVYIATDVHSCVFVCMCRTADGDGVPDLVVGAPDALGLGYAVSLLLHLNGTVIAHTILNSWGNTHIAGSKVGSSITALHDADGDGIPDVGIGGPGVKCKFLSNPANCFGVSYVASLDASGAIPSSSWEKDYLYNTIAIQATWAFGSGISTVDDIDG